MKISFENLHLTGTCTELYCLNVKQSFLYVMHYTYSIRKYVITLIDNICNTWV